MTLSKPGEGKKCQRCKDWEVVYKGLETAYIKDMDEDIAYIKRMRKMHKKWEPSIWEEAIKLLEDLQCQPLDDCDLNHGSNRPCPYTQVLETFSRVARRRSEEINEVDHAK